MDAAVGGQSRRLDMRALQIFGAVLSLSTFALAAGYFVAVLLFYAKVRGFIPR